MPISVQEHLLRGRSAMEKWTNARALGLDGVEVDAANLTARVPDIAAAIEATGVRVAAVNLGRRDGYLSPLRDEREAAISAMRQAMADAVDLNAAHVIFVPHFGSSRMPDLTPYRAPIELDAEMMIWLLRTVSDLAYAMDIELDMMPVNHYETSFMTRLEHAVRFRRKIKDHAHIKIAANLFHTALEETDWLGALREHLPHIGYLQLSEHNCRLPGQGVLDFAALAGALGDYNGWLTCACEEASEADLRASLDYLRGCGFGAK
jgi:sugar phosphate isomerase/epimerase